VCLGLLMMMMGDGKGVPNQPINQTTKQQIVDAPSLVEGLHTIASALQKSKLALEDPPPTTTQATLLLRLLSCFSSRHHTHSPPAAACSWAPLPANLPVELGVERRHARMDG
jgi:hypothetical protein